MIKYDIHHTDRADGYVALKKAKQIIKKNIGGK